jgi:ATP-dependent RNA/DNA helicase IGHMBP2
MVRSNDKKEVGFLADFRRMNVAITRAKKSVILIGDCDTI